MANLTESAATTTITDMIAPEDDPNERDDKI